MTSQLFQRAREDGRALLSEVESKQVVQRAGIATAEASLAADAEQAVAAADAIGYPVVLKVISAEITHKSDVGGVELGLRDATAVRAAFDRIMAGAGTARPEAKLDGVSVQAMARPGTEVIIGVIRDPQFGPVLMFGLGGILVEVLRDVSFRLIPVSRRDVRQMIREITAFPLLEGYRGREPADLTAIEDMLLKVSGLVEAHPEIEELDLNPVLAYRDSALAVDARVVLSSS
ncbi:MAG: acetate--CoA ligase family protein [Dehalococcoidia bacterium]